MSTSTHTNALKEHVDAIGADLFEMKSQFAQIKEAKGDQEISQEMKTDNADARLTALEQKMDVLRNRPLKGSSETEKPREVKSFVNYLRTGAMETKSFSGSEDPEGGHLVPATLANEIHSQLTENSFFRKLATVVRVRTDAYETLLSEGNMDVGWAAEKDPHDETGTPTFLKVKIPVHELYARPRATQRVLDDAGMNFEQWLMAQVTQQMIAKETEAFLTGDGNGKPRGFLTRTDEASGSQRLDVLKTGADGEFAETNPEHALLDLFHSLKPGYLQGAVWVMSRSAQAEVRKLKDPSNMHFLWQPPLSQELRPTLLGHPVYVTDHMPALTKGTAASSIAFGNFRSGYQIVDRQDIRIVRDPYSVKPYVEFYTTKRLGGDVVNKEAIKILNFAK
jgi:HK97 family phage major capsid protein